MRTLSKERNNIPITYSILHDQEYHRLCYLLQRSKNRRAFTEYRVSEKKSLTESADRRVSNIQMIHREEDV
jgi:hypothetical protein